MDDIAALISWLDNEKEWLFPGLGLSFLAAICFLVRWLIVLVVSEDEADHIQELLDLRKHVDTRFDVLAAWIQLIHKEQISRTSSSGYGFHEAPATFEHDAKRQADSRHGKQNLKNLDVSSVSIENWPGALLKMDATETHLDQIKKRNQKALRAKTVLRALGWCFFAASTFCFVLVVF